MGLPLLGSLFDSQASIDQIQDLISEFQLVGTKAPRHPGTWE